MTDVSLVELNRIIRASPAQKVWPATTRDLWTKDWSHPKYDWEFIRCPEELGVRSGRIPVYLRCKKTGSIRRELIDEYYNKEPIAAKPLAVYNLVMTETIIKVVSVSASCESAARAWAADKGEDCWTVNNSRREVTNVIRRE